MISRYFPIKIHSEISFLIVERFYLKNIDPETFLTLSKHYIVMDTIHATTTHSGAQKRDSGDTFLISNGRSVSFDEGGSVDPLNGKAVMCR